MEFVDIGVNLTNKQFAKDAVVVIENAINVGVKKIILTGTNETGAVKAHTLTSQFPGTLYSTAGVHPHDAKGVSSNFTQVLEQLYRHENVVAIGECGLDFNRDFSPRLIQERVFEKQVELAVELNAPLFMHQREAHARFVELIKPYANKISKVVVHCFTGTRQELSDYLELGFYIGITGWICDERRGLDVRRLTRDVPLDKLMIETDAPFLLPRDLPHKPKTKRNEPKYLPHILSCIAQEREVSETQLADALWKNSIDFFGL